MRKHRFYVHVGLFVTLQLLGDTLAVLSLGKLCEGHGCSYVRLSGQRPQLTKRKKSTACKTENVVPCVIPGLTASSNAASSSTSPVSDLSCSCPTTRRSVKQASGDWSDTPKPEENKSERGMIIEVQRNVCETFHYCWTSSQTIWKTQKRPFPHTILRTQIRKSSRKCHQTQGCTVIISLPERPKNAKYARGPR